MLTKPLISIVLPVYNGQRYLAHSIESVIAQNFQDWELLIVDDCSQDNSVEIARDYAASDTRIRLIRHEQNKRLPASLNTGFNAAQGTYFSWTSDDNLYRPHALERMLATLQSNPQYSLVYSDYSLIDENGALIKKVKVAEPERLVMKSTVDVCFLYKREVHEALGGYDEQLFLIEDYDFWMRASKQFQLLALHEDLYEYRHHEHSLTVQKRQEVMLRREAMLIRHLPELPWASRSDKARGYLHVSQLAAERGNSQRSRVYWFKAFLQNPLIAIAQFINAEQRSRISKWLRQNIITSHPKA